MSNCGPQFIPLPDWRVRVDLNPIVMSTAYSFSTSMRTIDLFCTVWPQCTTRQATDRLQKYWEVTIVTSFGCHTHLELSQKLDLKCGTLPARKFVLLIGGLSPIICVLFLFCAFRQRTVIKDFHTNQLINQTNIVSDALHKATGRPLQTRGSATTKELSPDVVLVRGISL